MISLLCVIFKLNKNINYIMHGANFEQIVFMRTQTICENMCIEKLKKLE